MKKEIEQLKNDFLKEVERIKNSEALVELEKKYLGRKGELSRHVKRIAEMGPEEKKEYGRLVNELKAELKEKFQAAKKVYQSQGRAGFVDVTLPGEKRAQGSRHPITRVQDELEEIFISLGFMILDGPELESEYYNFEALNIPAHHPARDMQDTFYIQEEKNASPDNRLLMRTHTSPVQIRAMLEYGAPLRCVAPGRVYRNEATDAVHEHSLHQIEGLMIGENISIASLISAVQAMFNGIFKSEVNIRVRPGYFPFVEPGLEFDIQCRICGGAKCPSCKHSGWLEMLGAGMVHPNVLRAGNIDPKIYTGFAFGMGIDRLAMMKYGIDDIRWFNSADLRFLEQF